MKSFKSLVSKSTQALSQLDGKTFPDNLPMNLKNYFDEELEDKWTGPFTFIQMADPQFGLIEKFIQKKKIPHWDEEMALTSAAIKCINKMRPKPKFVVICGDMLDAHPSQPDELKVREEQYEDFVEIFQQLDPEIPLVCVCGNHDICDEPTPLSYIIYRKQFGPDFFSFRVGGVKFVVLNSQYFKKPECLPKRADKQMEFIRGIRDDSAKHLVVFQHIPFFVENPDEEDVSYLNIEKVNRYSILENLEKQGVNYIFCGHYHRNGGGRFRKIEQIVTTALGGTFGEDPSGFRLCHVTEHGILHQFIPVMADKATVPKSIKSNQCPLCRHNFMKFLRTCSAASVERYYKLHGNENKSGEVCSAEDSGAVVENLDNSVFQPPIGPEPFTLQDFLTIQLFHSFSKNFPSPPKYWR